MTLANVPDSISTQHSIQLAPSPGAAPGSRTRHFFFFFQLPFLMFFLNSADHSTFFLSFCISRHSLS